MIDNFETKLKSFAEVLEKHTIARLHRDDLACQCNLDNAKTTTHTGKKYARVDIGSSGRYMVVIDTGEIFGIKAYGVIHKGHRYGTLDTVSEWFWGGYVAEPVINN